MVSAGSISGQLINENDEPFAETRILCKLDFADGIQKEHHMKTDSAGRFKLNKLTPGIVKLSIEVDSDTFEDVLGESFEIKPGSITDLGRLTLKNSQDIEKNNDL